MDTILWIIWAIIGGGYLAMLLLTTGCERRFMEDPNRWVTDDIILVVDGAGTARRPAPAATPAFVRRAYRPVGGVAAALVPVRVVGREGGLAR